MFDTTDPDGREPRSGPPAGDDALTVPGPRRFREQLCARIAALVGDLSDTPAEMAHPPTAEEDTDGGPENADRPDGGPDAGPDAAVLRRLTEVGWLIDRLEAERAALLHRAHEDGVLERDGAPTPASWLRRNTSLTARQSSVRGRIVQRLRDLPVVTGAFRDGTIGVAHMTQIDRLCRDTGTADVVALQTPLVVAAARLRDVEEFTKVCTGWRHALAPDALDERDDRNDATRTASIAPTFDGVVHVSARLDAEGGAALLTAVNALITPDSPDTPHDQRRTWGQHVADALVELAQIHLRAGTLPDVAGERPHVTVRVHESTVHGAPGAPPATIDGVGPVGAATARRLLSDATFTRVVMGTASQPIDIGTATRRWPTGIRRAITERDRRCRFPGCARPPNRCDIDHVRPVERDGPTCVNNGILLCRFHHRQKRPDGWWPVLRPDGTVRWRHPLMPPRTDHPDADLQQWVGWLVDASPEAAGPQSTGDRSDRSDNHADGDEDPDDVAGEEPAVYSTAGRTDAPLPDKPKGRPPVRLSGRRLPAPRGIASLRRPSRRCTDTRPGWR